MNTNNSNAFSRGFLKPGIRKLSQQFIAEAFEGPPKQGDLPYILRRAKAEFELMQSFLYVNTGEFDDINGDLEDAYRIAEILIRAIGYLEAVAERAIER